MRNVSNGRVTVVLNGQGADELLAGYPAYYPTYLRQLLRQGRVFEFRRELTSWSQVQELSIGSACKWLAAPLWPERIRRRLSHGNEIRSFEDSFLHADFRQQAATGTRRP